MQLLEIAEDSATSYKRRSASSTGISSLLSRVRLVKSTLDVDVKMNPCNYTLFYIHFFDEIAPCVYTAIHDEHTDTVTVGTSSRRGGKSGENGLSK